MRTQRHWTTFVGWSLLAVLAGCLSGRSRPSWRTKRPPSRSYVPTPMTPSMPRAVTPQPATPRSTPAPTNGGKRVPEPTPDPQDLNSARTSPPNRVRVDKPEADAGTTIPRRPRFIPAPSKDHPADPAEGGPRLSIPQSSELPAPTERRAESDQSDLRFEALAAPRDSPMRVVVVNSPQRPLGGTVAFDVTVTNESDRSLDNVLVRVDFDESLSFPGRAEKRLQRPLGKLLFGQSREMRLTLVGSILGSHDCRFDVSADGFEPARQVAHVEFVSPKLTLRLLGPARRTIGSRAEFSLKVSNTLSQPIDDAKVTLNHDGAIVLHDASTGARRESSRLTWSLPRLAAGETVQLQAEFDCRHASEQACVTAEVESAAQTVDSVESCVTVVPVPGLLDLRVADRNDPVQAGGAHVEFDVSVQNIALQAVGQVRLDLQTSEHLRLDAHSVTLNNQAVALTRADRNGGVTLTLDKPLPPDATLRLLMRAKPLHPGDGELLVIASCGQSPTPTESSELVTIRR